MKRRQIKQGGTASADRPVRKSSGRTGGQAPRHAAEHEGEHSFVFAEDHASGRRSSAMVELCLLAGEIMLRTGAETQRAEDTMVRIAATCGYPNAQSFVTPTGILFSLDEGAPAKLIRVAERSTDLQKVAFVNQISREIAAGRLTPEQALAELRRVSAAPHAYPLWVQQIAASVAAGCFLIMFGGTWGDAIPALAAGGVGYAVFQYVHRWVGLRFFSEFLAALMIGLIALLAVRTGLGSEMDKIIIGSVMPLVPGLLITNAIRDLMAGHLVSTLSKGADALLTSLAIGTGIAVVIALAA